MYASLSQAMLCFNCWVWQYKFRINFFQYSLILIRSKKFNIWRAVLFPDSVNSKWKAAALSEYNRLTLAVTKVQERHARVYSTAHPCTAWVYGPRRCLVWHIADAHAFATNTHTATLLHSIVHSVYIRASPRVSAVGDRVPGGESREFLHLYSYGARAVLLVVSSDVIAAFARARTNRTIHTTWQGARYTTFSSACRCNESSLTAISARIPQPDSPRYNNLQTCGRVRSIPPLSLAFFQKNRHDVQVPL